MADFEVDFVDDGVDDVDTTDHVVGDAGSTLVMLLLLILLLTLMMWTLSMV